MGLFGQTRPELRKWLDRARSHKMTAGEIASQRRSWVIGEMMLANPELTHDQAEAIYDRASVIGEQPEREEGE